MTRILGSTWPNIQAEVGQSYCNKHGQCASKTRSEISVIVVTAIRVVENKNFASNLTKLRDAHLEVDVSLNIGVPTASNLVMECVIVENSRQIELRIMDQAGIRTIDGQDHLLDIEMIEDILIGEKTMLTTTTTTPNLGEQNLETRNKVNELG